jgi:hypothetical protein
MLCKVDEVAEAVDIGKGNTSVASTNDSRKQSNDLAQFSLDLP